VGPSWNEDPHCEATRGVGPVTGSVGSERRSGRGGRHAAPSARGPLGAHTIERPSPCSHSGTGPAGPRGGDRVPAGLPEGTRFPSSSRLAGGESGKPSRGRHCRERIGPQVAAGSPEAAWDRVTEGLGLRWRGSGPSPVLPVVGRNPDGTTSSTSRGDPRHRLDDGAAGAEEPDGRGGRHHHLDPRASWCSYHQVTFKSPPPHRLAGGRWGRTGAKIHTTRQLAASAR